MTTPLPSVRHAVDPWRLAAARAAHPTASTGAGTLLADIAAGLAAVSPPWELPSDLTSGDQEPSVGQLARQLLLATAAYDAWLVRWPPGAALEAHDHGPSAGAFAVVSGVLEETSLRASGPVTTHLGPGDAVHFAAGHVHALANRSPAAATSVHVYSPPLRRGARWTGAPT